jgi:hypothetical protein
MLAVIFSVKILLLRKKAAILSFFDCTEELSVGLSDLK